MKESLESLKCDTCCGIGTVDDADIGDISYNEKICPSCKGTGVKDAPKHIDDEVLPDWRRYMGRMFL